MLGPLTPSRLSLLALAALVATAIVTTAALRGVMVYRMLNDVASIKESQRHDQQVDDATIAGLNARLDAIERTLYAQPLPAPGLPAIERRQSAIEQSLLAQIKENRDRLTALERWRLRIGEP